MTSDEALEVLDSYRWNKRWFMREDLREAIGLMLKVHSQSEEMFEQKKIRIAQLASQTSRIASDVNCMATLKERISQLEKDADDVVALRDYFELAKKEAEDAKFTLSRTDNLYKEDVKQLKHQVLVREAARNTALEEKASLQKQIAYDKEHHAQIEEGLRKRLCEVNKNEDRRFGLLGNVRDSINNIRDCIDRELNI